MSATTMRCFVALPLDAGLAAALARWVPREKAHVTLKFLGEVDAPRLAEVQRALDSLTPPPPFMLGLDGFGTFPERGAPRVFWARLSGDLARLCAFVGEIERVVAPLGFPGEARPFTPHVTIARAKSPRHARELAASLAGQTVSTEPARHDRFVLFRSVREATGSRYEPIAVYALA